MSFANARGSHEQQTLFRRTRIILNESLGQDLRFFQRLGLLRCRTHVGAITFKVAMLVAFGNVGALDDALRANLHTAIAGDGNSAGGAVEPGYEFPTGSSAKRAILESHGDSIRLRG